MSMAIAAVAVAAIGTGYSIYAGERAASSQQDAIKRAKEAQDKQEQQADEAMNSANPKRPGTAGIMSQLQQAAKGGPSGTMLTGATGIDPSTLNLGRSTLLGA